MKFIEHAGEDICLILAQPNRSTPPRITAALPFTDVERSIGAREARRSFSRSSRYTYEYTPWLKNAAFATEFRVGLVRLKEEPVAVPLWDDSVKLSVACSSGATSLSKTSDLPVRYGAEWIILAPEPSSWSGWVYEIVTVTSVGSSLMGIASPGTAFAWPAGSLMYPLLFGRLEERPELNARTPQKVTGALKIREDSPFARKLNVTAVSLTTVGLGVPAYSGYYLFDTEPLYSNLLDTTEVDIIYQQLGFLRQEQKYVYQQPVRRGLEMEFVCKSRTAIAKVERLLSLMLGTTQPFFIPTFRQDLVITVDFPRANPNQRKIAIESSEYSDADRPVHPGDPYVAFVAPADFTGTANIDAHKLAGVLGPILTTTIDITQTHLARNTRLSHLLLVRFGSPQIAWENLTPTRARCRLRFIEVPDEYVTPATAKREVAYLFEWTTNLPEPQVQRFTSYEDSLTYGGQTFTPAPFSHESHSSGIRLDREECVIKSWGGDFPGNPMANLFPYTLEGSLSLRIIEVDATSPDSAFARVIFSGNVTRPEMAGKDWKATCRWLGNFIDRNIPRHYFQKTDNVALFSAASGLDKEDFEVPCTFRGDPGTNTVVELNGGDDKPEDYFAQGFCETGEDDNYECRPILHSEVVFGRLNITIDRRFRNAVADQNILLWPGTNGSLEQFIALAGNAENFRGYPYIPIKDPSTNIGEVATEAGGKKG